MVFAAHPMHSHRWWSGSPTDGEMSGVAYAERTRPDVSNHGNDARQLGWALSGPKAQKRDHDGDGLLDFKRLVQ